MKLLSIKLIDGEYIVNDHFTKKPTKPCDELNEAIELCRMRLERTIYEVLYVIKVPFIGLWLVW